ncbi:MAG TPA: hypothetical protein VI522_00545 [Gammaproteobacteria bacterium]|nr:hypothetical protein [Candidatus Woesearchaeota archaeon]HLF66083.1 hypothetical protein [Gammaproteobacteria bacterium]
MPKFKIDEITLVLIVALIAMVVGVYNKTAKLEMEAGKIAEVILDDHAISFVNNGVIDGDKLSQIQNMDYNQFKDYLKVKNDFCIYIEDGNGNILLAKGSSKLGRDGLYCRE